jgi:hypothetical protein
MSPNLLRPGWRLIRNPGEREVVQLYSEHGSLGDQIAFLGAARHYAKLHPHQKVVVANLPNLVDSYGDDLVSSGEASHKIISNPELRHRVKRESPDFNYLGTYMAELGLGLKVPPAIALPRMAPLPGLFPRAYICLQPYAGFAKNLGQEAVQRLVEICRRVCPEWPVVVGGSPRTPMDLEGVEYGYLGDPAALVRLIQHAAVVVTPRSASAHIASAYGVPAFVWTTEDGENWHLDYPDWPHDRIDGMSPEEQVGRALARVLIGVRTGVLDRPAGIRRALVRSGFEEGPGFFWSRGTAPPGGLVDVSDCPSPAFAVRVLLGAVSDRDPGRYPEYLNHGNAAEYVLEEASLVCSGQGLDIGAGDWPLLGAVPVRDEPHQNAYRLPAFGDGSLDFVFSSHVLEHLHRPEEALALWTRKLKSGGILFLYLPHPAMELWHPEGPWGGDHRWIISPRQVRRMLESLGLRVRIATEVPDAYWSFRCVATKEAL